MKYIEQYIKENLLLQPLGKVTLQPDEDEAGWSGVNVCINNVDTNLFISHIDYATWLESKVHTIPKLEFKVNNIPEKNNLSNKII